MASIWEPKSVKIGSRPSLGSPRTPRVPKGTQKGAKSEPKGTPKGARMEPKGAKKEPKGAKRKPKGSPKAPNGAKREPKGQKGVKREPEASQKVPNGSQNAARCIPGFKWSQGLKKRNHKQQKQSNIYVTRKSLTTGPWPLASASGLGGTREA